MTCWDAREIEENKNPKKDLRVRILSPMVRGEYLGIVVVPSDVGRKESSFPGEGRAEGARGSHMSKEIIPMVFTTLTGVRIRR